MNHPLGALMDQLLKDFELLSLPSRVNLEELSDSSIDRYEKFAFKNGLWLKFQFS
jgi:hypothetical protein